MFLKKNYLLTINFFFKKKCSPNFLLPQKRTLQTIYKFQNNLEKNYHNSNPSY